MVHVDIFRRRSSHCFGSCVFYQIPHKSEQGSCRRRSIIRPLLEVATRCNGIHYLMASFQCLSEHVPLCFPTKGVRVLEVASSDVHVKYDIWI